MSTQTKLNDAERVAIEKVITEIYQKLWESGEKVDISPWSSMISDAYNLGSIDSGEFFQTGKDITDRFREGFKRLERQETLERLEFHLAVLAPDVVVGTSLTKVAVYHKDGNVFTGYFAHTYIIVKIDGLWKLIHFHQSVQPVE